MSKVLARNITRKDALSYEQTVPNRLGVTSLSEVNGRGSYRRRYNQTKRILRGKTSGAELRPNGAEAGVKKPTKRQQAAMRKMSPARRAAFAKMIAKAPRIGSVRPSRRRRHKANKGATSDAYRKGYENIFGPKAKKRASKAEAAAARKALAAERKLNKKLKAQAKKAAAKEAAPKKPRVTHKQFLEEKMQRMTYAQAEAAWKRTHTRAGKAKSRRRPKARTYGGGRFTPLTASIGGVKKRTYLYRAKSGKVRRIPTYAVLGYPSRYAMAMESKSPKGGAKLSARVARLENVRKRSAEASAKRILKGRGIFTPNPGTREMSWEEWREMKKYEDNARKKKGKKSTKKGKGRKAHRTAKQRAAARRNIKKAQAARRKSTRKPARRHTRKHSKAYTRRKAAHRRYARAGYGKFKSLKRTRGRRKASRITFPTRGARKVALTFYKNRRRRPARRNAARKAQIIRYSPTSALFESNRRRRSHRKGFRRNPMTNWVSGLKEALKVGGIVVVGYISHRALTKVLTEQVLRKISMFQDPTSGIGKWTDIIAGVLVAAAGVPAVIKFAPSESAAIGGGMAASLLHAVIIKALGEAGQPDVASYLSAYPDSSAPASRAIGSYYTFKPHQMMGMGEYYSPSNKALTYGQLTQAAAGMGQVNPNALVTQAAAGTGEYLAYGANGLGGDYDEVAMAHVPTAMDEGIYPTLDAAEQALNVMEAAAGVGAAEIPLQSTVYPTDMARPVSDEPMGSRSGVFDGGGGIFGQGH